MILTTREKTELNKGKMYVGVDLGKYSIQISYMRTGMDAPETAEQVTGSEVFNIPMILCKRRGVNQWFYGREALKYYEKEGGYLIDGILQKAINGESEIVENESIEGTALLTLFIKRSLSILGGAHTNGSISDIMFTCEELSGRVVDVMSRVVANLQLRNCNIYFQSYAESIYNYMLHQDNAIWNNNVFLSTYDGKNIVNYRFARNLRTTPIVTFVEKSDPIELLMDTRITDDNRAEIYNNLDLEFMGIMHEEIGDEQYSAVYLLGDGFKDNWADASLKFLGKNRRLFVGNDLFSRGACYALVDRYTPSNEVRSHVFLGPDKLKSNIGMQVLRRGEESYLALMDAGLNWFDLKVEYELFVPDDYKLVFVTIPLNGGAHLEHEFVLDNPPDRDADTFRVLLQMEMSDVNTVHLHIKDVGFGELYESSGLEWNFVLEV